MTGAKRLRITGIVQGVGYRMSFRAKAQALGLSGWVRNRTDGSVEAVVLGPAEAVDSIVEWSWQGPPAAEVDDVRVSEEKDTAIPAGRFEQRPTV